MLSSAPTTTDAHSAHGPLLKNQVYIFLYSHSVYNLEILINTKLATEIAKSLEQIQIYVVEILQALYIEKNYGDPGSSAIFLFLIPSFKFLSHDKNEIVIAPQRLRRILMDMNNFCIQHIAGRRLEMQICAGKMKYFYTGFPRDQLERITNKKRKIVTENSDEK